MSLVYSLYALGCLSSSLSLIYLCAFAYQKKKKAWVDVNKFKYLLNPKKLDWNISIKEREFGHQQSKYQSSDY